ncbi:hypothetical protein [Shewanella dokdonensis]|uniref:Membrane anchored protein in chemotaxis locus n=1 Tax=Shewanella dokdonensis TaxID=712036 RepID=A0ABX8DHL8_9GAMM|nr:hypothetical protein [Shewanella dokdonensis]MCL1073917.1 hypothetical protein [Shewanella dokdonensis]QVK23691.1 hypothetical protein KHX94_02975 [Shewanella dokdonensis]
MADNADRQTGYWLSIFLLSLAVLVLAAVSWQLHVKNQLLQQETEQLRASQVVLMVPDAQAAQIADWMVKHPDQTASLLDVVKPVQEGTKSLQQSLDDARQKQRTQAPEPANKPNSNDKLPPAASATPVMVEQLQNGVKVIRLPHGGIRVTTRDVNDE